MESDNSNFKTQALGILLMPIFLHFFFGGGGGRGGELEEKPPVPQTDPAWVVLSLSKLP